MLKGETTEDIAWIIPFLLYAVYLFVISSYGYVDTYYASFGLYVSFLDRPVDTYFFYGLKKFLVREADWDALAYFLVLSGLPFILFFAARRLNRFCFPKDKPEETPHHVQDKYRIGISTEQCPEDTQYYRVAILKRKLLPRRFLKYACWLLFVLLLYITFVLGTFIAYRIGDGYARDYILSEIGGGSDSKKGREYKNTSEEQLFEGNKVVFLTKKIEDEGNPEWDRKDRKREQCYRFLHMDSTGLYVYREPPAYKWVEGKEDTKYKDQRIIDIDLLLIPKSTIDHVRFGDRLFAPGNEKCYPEEWKEDFISAPDIKIIEPKQKTK